MSSAGLAIAAIALLLLGAGLLLLAQAGTRAQREAARAFVQAQTEQVRSRYASAAELPPVTGPRDFKRRWADLLRRADLEPTRRTYLLWGGPPLLLCAAALIGGGFVAAAAMAVVCLAICACLLWRRTIRFHHRLCEQLPGFLDGVVRLMTIGSAVPAAFQHAIGNTELPLRQCLVQAVHLQRAGKELDQAVMQVARSYRFDELILLASVLRLATRYGGRADIVMERTAAYMRDREQAQRELSALSAETRMSAWILGLLPVVVAGLMFVFNAGYLLMMWNDPSGRLMLMAAFGLEIVGALLLYRLARSV